MERYAPPCPQTVCLGVDFGTGLLVIAGTGSECDRCQTLGFPGWSGEVTPPGAGDPVHGIPVLVHYGEDDRRTMGEDVVRAGLDTHPSTARWIRKYLVEESPVRIPVAPDRYITFREAATDFLTAVLTRAGREYSGPLSVIFAVPPERPEWYAAWLGSIAQAAGIRSWSAVGEPTAILAGYALAPEPGKEYLLIRWDETDLSVSCVRSGEGVDPAISGGLEVTGSASDLTGCSMMDLWVAKDILSRSPVRFAGMKAQQVRDGLIRRIPELYSRLASSAEATVTLEDPRTGSPLTIRISHKDIVRILKEHGCEAVLTCTIDRAEASARARGSEEWMPAAVLMVGRGCAIPGVRDLIAERYAGIPVHADHLFDAVARGAARTRPRKKSPDRIVHDYALRYWDPKSREHRYRFLVCSGTPYPSAGQVARITISAAYDGQTSLGIPLYEIRPRPDARVPSLELVSDEDGGIRLAGPAEDACPENGPVPVGGRIPVLLPADPPAHKGEPRFELTFVLDGERRLLVTARDLVTGILVKKDAPVHQLC